MKYFVCATIRILGAWLSEETQALRDEVYDILPFILQLGSDTFEAQKLAKLAALPGRGSNDLSNFTPESALTILQKHGMYTKMKTRPPLTQSTFSEFYGCAAHGFYRYQKVMCQIFLKLLENSGRTGISKSM